MRPPYQACDLSDVKMPRLWDQEVISVVRAFGSFTLMCGSSSTSREPAQTAVRIRVLTGDVIRSRLGWLFDLYKTDLLRIAQTFYGQKLFPANDIRSSINVNLLEGKGSRYEWHVDSNPVTGLLFVNTLRPEDGGELMFKRPDCEFSVSPQARKFLAFDATSIPHCVMPLRTNVFRASIPMNYYLHPIVQDRPVDLDKYLYSDPGV